MWICPKCAAHNDDKAQGCPRCGTRWLSQPADGSAAEYPVPVDPWAAHADTQTALSPVDHAPTNAPPTSGGPAFNGPTTPVPSPTRPFHGAIVPAPQPPTQTVTQYPIRPATIEVTQRNGLPLRWVITVAAVLVVGIGVAAAIVVPKLLGDDNKAQPGPTGPSTTPSSAAPSSADPQEGGLVVAISPEVSDQRADEVVAMLDVYFNAINAKDYPAVASVLDPDGTVDPDDEDDMQELADGTRSTTDSGVTLTALANLSDGLLAAKVTFTSHQKEGDGPAERPDETCTKWNIIYALSHDDAYRIRKSAATSSPC
jgi:hypothetical protein